MQEQGTSSGNISLRKLRRDWWKSKLCSSCVSPLGRIISRGGVCPSCGLRVCKNCRNEIQPGSGVWVCVLCSSQGGGGISQDIFGKTKSLGRDSRSIRRSWSISTPQRAQTNSPVLKSYTVLHPEESLGIGASSTLNVIGSGHGIGSETGSYHSPNNGSKSHRQFHSLPRMSSDPDRGKNAKRSFNQEFEKENIKRHRSFQSTLHPYQVPNPPSPSASINFIEDPFWDYWDWDLEESPPRSPRHSRVSRFRSLASGSGGGSLSILQRRNSIKHKLESDMDRLLKLNLRTNSNRSSCERSLGETYDYDFSRNYSLNYSNYSSLSDTELNDNSKYEQEESYNNQSLSPRRFSTESNFYRFATVTPVNMSPLSDSRKEKGSALTTSSSLNPTPVKPERKCNKNKRSFSLNSYDGKKLFSPLRTYVVVMKENVVPKVNNISDASITNANVNTINSSENNSYNDSKRGNNNVRIGGTTANLQERLRPRPRENDFEHEINNSTRFHSLPRERVIRIEREDGRFSKPKEKSDFADQRSKNISKVEITRSASSVSAKDYQTIGGNVTKVPIIVGGTNGKKISRSQSHREISSVNKLPSHGHYNTQNHPDPNCKVPFLSIVNLNSSSKEAENVTFPVIREKDSVSTVVTGFKQQNQKPLLNSLLADKDTASVMENFLKSPSHKQNQTSSIPSCKTFASGGNAAAPRTNEKCSTSSKKSDFVQSQKSDFENFQRQQMQTFDNYLRQCSTFPRALQKHKNSLNSQQEQSQNLSQSDSKQGFDTQPTKSTKRHTSTTLITKDDNFVKSLDNLDDYFLPRGNHVGGRARSEMQLHDEEQYAKKPSATTNTTFDNNVEVGPGWSWSATLPHPYIRKHKQQKSSFLREQQQHLEPLSKEKTRIIDVEREIERDIYFQKTKSLDRVKPIKPKASIFDTRFDNIQVDDNKRDNQSPQIPPPPVASPRLKRKGKVVALADGTSNPKINGDHQQDCVNGTGTNYQHECMPNEPRPANKDHNIKPHFASSSAKSFAGNKPASQQANRFILEKKQSQSEFANNSTQLNKSASFTFNSDNTKATSDSNMKMTTNHNQKSSDLAQQVECDPIPVATPRTRRRNMQQQHRYGENKQPNFHDFNQDSLPQSMEGDDVVNNGITTSPPQSPANIPKAVRFDIKMENERKHNKGSRTNVGGMRMNNNSNHNNKLRTHLGTFGTDDDDDANVVDVDSPDISSSTQFNSDIAAYHHSGRNIYSFQHHHGQSPPKSNKRASASFVARAIAKVKSKAAIKGKGKGKNNNGGGGFNSNKSNLINSNTKLRSVETRDSITYISPPPTQHINLTNTQKHKNHKHNQSESVIQEITLNPIPLSGNLNGSYNTDQQQQHGQSTQNFGVVRSESFSSSKGGILKNSENVESTNSPRPLNLNKSPPKPKRSSLKKSPNMSDIIPIPKSFHSPETDPLEVDGDHKPLPSLTIDQLTPSSTSSSSSSYHSHLQESYDLFHADEECESVGEEEEEGESDNIFKSFEDDEDAGGEFFYSQADDGDDHHLTPSHAYHPARNLNQIVNNNNQIPQERRNYKDALLGNNSGTETRGYHGKDAAAASAVSHHDKGLQQKQGNNEKHHHQHYADTNNTITTTSPEYYVKQEGVAFNATCLTTTPNNLMRNSNSATSNTITSSTTTCKQQWLRDPAIPSPLESTTSSPQAKTSLIHNQQNYNNQNRYQNSDCKSGLQPDYFSVGPKQPHLSSREYYGTDGEKNNVNNEETTNKDSLRTLKNHLLLPLSSSSFKSATLPSKKSYQQHYSQSEFFPGAAKLAAADFYDKFDDVRGMSSSSLPLAPKGKFKSSVLVNPAGEEDDLPDAIVESARRALRSPSPNQKEIPVLPRGGKRSKNVTTVEISGDVGIVNSSTASAFLSSARAQLKKVNNESLWKNDVYSSGLSKLNKSVQQKNEELENNSNNNNNIPTSLNAGNSHDNYDEEHMKAEPEEEAREQDSEISAVSHNGSGGSSSLSSAPRNKTVSSDDGEGSDWHSESTKNTVIFRGEDPSRGVGGFNYENCDPEIHISSITVVDNRVTGSAAVTDHDSKSTSNHAKADTFSETNKVKSNKSAYDKDKIIDDNNDISNRKTFKSLGNSVGDCDAVIKSKASQGVDNDVGHSIQELTKSNEALTDFDDHLHSEGPLVEEFEDMVQCPLVKEDKALSSGSPNSKSSPRSVPNNQSSSFPKRRESPEGQEQETPVVHPDDKAQENEKKPTNKKHLGLGEVVIMEKPHKGSAAAGHISKSKISQNALNQITAASRSSPDGADADKSEADSTTTTEPEGDSPTPIIENFDVTSDEDSWVEEMIFEEDDTEIQMCRKVQPPPLDLTLHTIVEESCEESEPESGHFNNARPPQANKQKRRLSSSQQNDNELEKYFNFGINTTGDNSSQGGRHSFTNEDSEFSDTFSESSFSMHDDDHEESRAATGASSGKRQSSSEMDPAELASSRLEKYFYNLGLPQSMINPISSINQTADSDSAAGSESESDNSVLENRKKVLKHHRRSADFEDEFGDKVSDEEEDFGFGQDGFDTIKKTVRKVKKSGSDSNLLESSGLGVSGSSSGGGGSGSKSSENILGSSANNTTHFTALGEHFPSPSNNRTKSPLGKTSSNETSSSSKDESTSSTSPTSPSTSKKFPPNDDKDRVVAKVNRSNSFQWSSDEEVNIMMSKLRQLIRNLVKSKTEQTPAATDNAAAKRGRTIASSPSSTVADKDKQLAYLEGELIRLMKTENLKNIVEYFDSEESDVDDVYKFIRVVKESGSINSNADDNSDDIDLEDANLLHTLHTSMQTDSTQSPKGSPALLAKVMHHIGNRLSVWMKDENMQDDDNNDDNLTLKCADDADTEDRFSWKGSFESALAAKRQSVGSTDSISSSDFQSQDRSILRSSSLHHLANSSHHLGQLEEEHKEDEETTSSLPRMTNLCNSLPRLNQPSNLSISRAHSLVDSSPVTLGPIKSARYRPPGFQPVKSKRVDDEGKNNSPILSQSTPMLTQDSGHLKVRSDSMGSIFHDATKSHIVVKGQVEFGLQYNYKLACLEVRVKQCRDLAAVDPKRNRSDPYVKAYLLPDRSKSGKRKTKTKKNTLNPVFEEILKFPVTLSDLQNRSMWLSVWHSDIFGKNEFLGEVLVELKDRVFDDPNPQSWDLQEMSGETEDMPRGDMIVALKWQPKTDPSGNSSTGNLNVLVKEAKNIAPMRSGGIPSSFIKCSLLSDKSRKHKTSVCRRSYNPVWNQTLTFEDAGDDGLEITLWNHDLLSNNELLGKVMIEYDNPLWASMLSRNSFWVEGVLRLC